jgi:ectoine hydroxylase-related dioxygenase (phytanoyl-CoA dioxygenase family)
MTDIISFFKQHGYYHGKAALSLDLVETFKSEFDPIFAEKQKRFYARFTEPGMYGANHDINRWNLLLPSESSMLRSAFFAQEELFNTLKSVFHGDFSLVFFSSDISSPGSTFQTIHQDGNDFAVALNVPLVDSNEVNGATQIYPDTHRISSDSEFTNESNEFTDEQIISRANALNPLTLNVKRGDYTLRDLRLIHRGTPNNTDDHRPYLSVIFLPSSRNEAPSFEVILEGLELFKHMKKEAFPTGNAALIDFANTFGRLVMAHSFSDRVQRPIPKKVSDQLHEDALYCLRFAKFEDETLNDRIVRNEHLSEVLKKEIEQAKHTFNELMMEL